MAGTFSGSGLDSTRDGEADILILGRITGLHGVKGWLKVYSETGPRQNILKYRPWLLRLNDAWLACEVEEGRLQGKGVVVKLTGIDDRDQAAKLLQVDIGVTRDQLPKPKPGEYYWADLEGMRVETADGRDLGRIDHLFATGSNDVLVVIGDRERLIPFIRGQVVLEIDLATRRMRVDWDPDF
ncbi:MAG: ribosome maturation factor RimM [Gammaproteobacteria bacterium RIFOXYA12_FULL_61_12]|nr:MAG: ribosome maturation factor RimM [Gammaproteobacteria bacterium RIFOXYA12_FULL_61_12]OGT89952.1 MAG: ribosome maturation factor RimM [Gammaproteobacteria bacterium RIFOXYD12_FULL_61_37]